MTVKTLLLKNKIKGALIYMKQNEQFNMRISPQLLGAIFYRAQQKNTTASGYIKELVMEDLKNLE